MFLIHGILALFLLFLVMPTSAASTAEVAELWTGSVYTSTYRIGICFSPEGKVRGVMRLRTFSGAVDVYHFWGAAKNSDVEARHSSGHRFTWRLLSPERVEGEIVLKSGRKIRIDGVRHHNARLAPDDCAPPAEDTP